MVQPHNPNTVKAREDDHWRFTVTCPGNGCDGKVIDRGTKAHQHEAQAAAVTASGVHKI